MPFDEKTPNPIDVHVGGRVRLRRKFLGKSQDSLAGHLDLTFQQVQKYERGLNRISASKLFEMARALHVPIAYFFEGYNETEVTGAFAPSRSEQAVQDFLATPEGLELAEAFPRIKVPKYRRRIVELVRSLAEE
jgi:transcriptional regulator with XRE-family HTH domain